MLVLVLVRVLVPVLGGRGIAFGMAMACRGPFVPKQRREKKRDGTSANYPLAVTIADGRPAIRAELRAHEDAFMLDAGNSGRAEESCATGHRHVFQLLREVTATRRVIRVKTGHCMNPSRYISHPLRIATAATPKRLRLLTKGLETLSYSQPTTYNQSRHNMLLRSNSHCISYTTSGLPSVSSTPYPVSVFA